MIQNLCIPDGPGLLVDLHGMTHTHEKLEIGYLYKPKDLNNGDYTVDVSSMQVQRLGGDQKNIEI